MKKTVLRSYARLIARTAHDFENAADEIREAVIDLGNRFPLYR